MLPIKYVFPLFLFNQMLAAVMRNDGDPGRATAAVLAGAEALWLAMPITEVLVMVYAAAVMRSYTAALKG